MIDPLNSVAIEDSPFFKSQFNLGFRWSTAVGVAISKNTELWLRSSLQSEGFQVGNETSLSQEYTLAGFQFLGRFTF